VTAAVRRAFSWRRFWGASALAGAALQPFSWQSSPSSGRNVSRGLAATAGAAAAGGAVTFWATAGLLAAAGSAAFLGDAGVLAGGGLLGGRGRSGYLLRRHGIFSSLKCIYTGDNS